MQLLRLCRAVPRSHLHNTLPSRSSNPAVAPACPSEATRRRRPSPSSYYAAGCFSQAHARHGLKRLVVPGQRRCAAVAYFPLHNTITPGPAATGDTR